MSDLEDETLDMDKSNQFLASMSTLEGGRRRFLHGTDESQVLVCLSFIQDLLMSVYISSHFFCLQFKMKIISKRSSKREPKIYFLIFRTNPFPRSRVRSWPFSHCSSTSAEIRKREERKRRRKRNKKSKIWSKRRTKNWKEIWKRFTRKRSKNRKKNWALPRR